MSEMRVTDRRNGVKGRGGGSACRDSGCSLQGESRRRQYQFTGIISRIWAVSQSVGVGNEFSQRQERKDVCVCVWDGVESTTGGNEREKWVCVCGQESAAAGWWGGRLMDTSLQKWLKNRLMMTKAFVRGME